MVDEGSDRRSITIVEDDEAIASLLSHVVEEFTAYTPLVVDNGEEAFATILASKPALVLLDIALPGADGFHIYESLKADARTSDIPIVFVTVHDSAYYWFRQRGARWFVSKPFELSELLSVIGLALEGRRRQAA